MKYIFMLYSKDQEDYVSSKSGKRFWSTVGHAKSAVANGAPNERKYNYATGQVTIDPTDKNAYYADLEIHKMEVTPVEIIKYEGPK